jgi:hypothetical protein
VNTAVPGIGFGEGCDTVPHLERPPLQAQDFHRVWTLIACTIEAFQHPSKAILSPHASRICSNHITMPQPLNSKDGASFRQLVKLYEAKQHKKAIKTADGILKKNPKHGDTKAMKALTLNAMGNTDDGEIFA